MRHFRRLRTLVCTRAASALSQIPKYRADCSFVSSQTKPFRAILGARSRRRVCTFAETGSIPNWSETRDGFKPWKIGSTNRFVSCQFKLPP